jgi:alkanesulfonate monooxygenase SsuD/methylene tetrahydromethanopterin reductase-like flavin-dependent oxidoreductase (luciferase family)
MLTAGLLLTSVHSADDPPERQVAEHRELIRIARELDFDLVVAGQHYAAPELRYLQPIPYLASLASEVAPMRVATGIILLPLQHPVAIAESMATLDVLSGGRAVFGVGIGYADKEFEVFGIDRRTRARRFEESLHIIRRLWSGESVTHEGEFFSLHDVQASVRPVQSPGPPVWVGAQAAPSVRRAARVGDAWYCPPFPTHRELFELRDVYDEERALQGLAAPDEFPLRREIVVADTVAEAQDVVARLSAGRYRTYADWGLDIEPGVGSGDDWLASRYVVGDPETVAERLDQIIRRTSASRLVIKAQWPGQPHGDAMRQLERIGGEVLPLLQKAT